MNQSWIIFINYMFNRRVNSCYEFIKLADWKKIIVENKWKNLNQAMKTSKWALNEVANMFVYFLKLIKSVTRLILLNKGFLLILSLIYLVGIQVISTSAEETETMPSFAGSVQKKVPSHQFKDYTANILNVTSITYAFTKNERKLFLQNIFPSSFIFYTYESSFNLINHEEILQMHFIYKNPRNSNSTRAKLRNNKKMQHPKSDKISASEEDYFQEYDDVFATNSGKYTSNFTASTFCSTCQHYEKAKKDSLESIKKHILMRLQLSQPPNITNPPPIVPQKILDFFYKNFNYSRTVTPLYKHHYNHKIHKRKQKVAEDELRVKENRQSTTLREEKDEDIMISDTTYDNIDEDFLNPLMQGDEFYSRLHSIYVFPTSKYGSKIM